MSNRPNLFQDVSRLAGDAANALGSVRTDVETAVKQRLERMLEDCDLVRREEFEAVQAMAAAARDEQDKMAARIAELEAKLEALASKPKPAAKKPATRKPAAKKPAAKKPAAESAPDADA